MRKHSLRDMDITSYMVEHGKGYIRSSVAALPYYSFAVLFEAGGRWHFLHGQKWLGNWDCSQSQFLLMVSTTALSMTVATTVPKRWCGAGCAVGWNQVFWRESSERPRTDGIDFFPWKEKEILPINDWEKKKLHQRSYSPRHMWSWRWWPWRSQQELL